MPLQYGMDDGKLKGIIDATNYALGRMAGVDRTVTDEAGFYISVNNSDSGRIMQSSVQDWCEKFGKIRGDLDQLNYNVAQLRLNNVRVSTGAVDLALGN
ncbi:MAG TPA: hypothetical protein VMU51_07595 [Mycobacteriales bacterium]|nr:hypothetical protein [Mycobacteriales bacterium]